MQPFVNEPYADFSQPEVRALQQAAVDAVRGEIGLCYSSRIAGCPCGSDAEFTSWNPAAPSQAVGHHCKGTTEMARRAVETAHAAFADWSRVPAATRADHLFRAAAILRRRKAEFNAWLIFEAGKSWPEAEAETCEAIDFCDYYARQMLRWASPEPLVQLPGERDVLRYLPLGVGVIIPPWNFPLAILCGMAVAALVAGNTVVIKPSSDTPTIAAKFVEVLGEAGFPPETFAFLTGAGAAVGDTLVQHPLTRFISFTGSRDVGLRINALAAQHQPGQHWIKRVIAEMGGKDAIIVDAEADLEAAAQGVVASAFGYQGQKCSACSRAIVDAAVYDRFLEMIVARTETLTVGPPEDPGNYMGPVISEKARRSILEYIHTGLKEGRLLTGGGPARGAGYFIEPTIIADVDRAATIFQEEIFGPVLAVTKARGFDHALELANASVYGLTGAVYSANRTRLDTAAERFHVGNLYLNRKCTGAMVGAHPFGGFNMSGTDSKAGGPDYLLQFLQGKSIAEKIA
ncbi:MAG: L-glutamate gamma-semialdehyde dehydrogenase [Bryobacterales bacterium]|nr:L-glutamate gamma-semialdehyde dehydrogenase [Bryobacterales bacterium]